MRDRLKAVLDTQIIVRGLIRIRPSSKAVQIFDLALRGRFTGVSSVLLLSELGRVLRNLDALAPIRDNIEAAVAQLSKRFVVVPGQILDLEQIVPDDLNDNPLFEAALEADAGYVVSDDLAVLNVKRVALKGFRPIEVLAPGPFLRLVKSRMKG